MCTTPVGDGSGLVVADVSDLYDLVYMVASIYWNTVDDLVGNDAAVEARLSEWLAGAD